MKRALQNYNAHMQALARKAANPVQDSKDPINWAEVDRLLAEPRQNPPGELVKPRHLRVK